MTSTERQLTIIKILCRRGHETMQNLADELGVCKRTIQRDIEAISIEVPVSMKKGKYDGGVYIEETYRSDKMCFTVEETALLYRIADALKEVSSDTLWEQDKNLFLALIKKYSQKVA